MEVKMYVRLSTLCSRANRYNKAKTKKHHKREVKRMAIEQKYNKTEIAETGIRGRRDIEVWGGGGIGGISEIH